MRDRLFSFFALLVIILLFGCQRQIITPTELWFQESIIVYDTVFIFDPKTYEETVLVKRFELSPRAYIENELEISPPEIVLNGKVLKVKDPYHPRVLYLKWNRNDDRLDTVKIKSIR